MADDAARCVALPPYNAQRPRRALDEFRRRLQCLGRYPGRLGGAGGACRVRQGSDDHRLRAGPGRQVHAREPRQLAPARPDHDQRGAGVERLHDGGHSLDRLALRLRAADEDHIRQRDLGLRGGRRLRAVGAPQRGQVGGPHGARHAVHIVGAQDLPPQAHQEVVVFISAAARAQNRHLRPAAQPRGDRAHRLRPRHLDQPAALAHHGLAQPRWGCARTRGHASPACRASPCRSGAPGWATSWLPRRPPRPGRAPHPEPQ